MKGMEDFAFVLKIVVDGSRAVLNQSRNIAHGGVLKALLKKKLASRTHNKRLQLYFFSFLTFGDSHF